MTRFQMPKAVKITGRSSTITNSFCNSIIPVIPPTATDITEALNILEMSEDSYGCAYCGDTASEWDHLRPLVINRHPTGYISEIQNLVPACGKCNQSKGNKHWEVWMTSNAKLSPATRAVHDIERRIACLHRYEQWRTPTCVDFASIVGSELWTTYWENREKVLVTMTQAQVIADQIREKVAHERSQSSGCDTS
jgi:hypothetical protein